MADFAPILQQTFTFEGGYDATANDSGNYNSLGQLVGTNHGISAPVYETYIKRPPTIADMKAITTQIAQDIYRKNFWLPVKGDSISSQSVAHIIFDNFVNSGYTAFKIARNAVNKIAGDGTIAYNSKPFTDSEIQIINSLDAESLFDQIKSDRIDFYNTLVASNPDKYGIYQSGWLNRINSFYFDDPDVPVVSPGTSTSVAPGSNKHKLPAFIENILAQIKRNKNKSHHRKLFRNV